ncbi:MAG: NUDIX hydrolase [Candidatus Bathyarchaeota archaeon]|nr:NUDIX hydrolase [Candidatus Bathyarchaeota archaeon]
MVKIGAGAILVEGDKVLLVRGPTTGYGLWTQPRGLWEEGETTKDTAIRECWEETGLKIRIKDIIAAIDLRIHRRDKIEQELFLSYSGEIVDAKNFGPRAEIEEIKWFPIEKALKRRDVSASTKVGIAKVAGKKSEIDLKVQMKDALWEVIP